MPNPAVSNFDDVRLLASLNLFDATKGRLFQDPFTVSAKTANYTILPSDPCGTLFTNRGAAGAVTFTLPAPTAVPAGQWYLFAGIAGQNILVATATADTLVTKNDAAADSVAMSTAGELIGGAMLAFCDGTAWVVIGIAVGHTFTVAT